MGAERKGVEFIRSITFLPTAMNVGPAKHYGPCNLGQSPRQPSAGPVGERKGAPKGSLYSMSIVPGTSQSQQDGDSISSSA
jgi:hypothetical protein